MVDTKFTPGVAALIAASKSAVVLIREQIDNMDDDDALVVLDELDTAIHQARNDGLAAAAPEFHAVLEVVEWGLNNVCPCCASFKEMGHSSYGCALHLALRKARGVE